MTQNPDQTGTAAAPPMARHELPVSTVASIAGREVVETLGEVLGIVTRPRDMHPNPQAARMLTVSRQEAVRLMVAMAKQAGADAVIGLRFDGGKIADGASEVTAYGTAVRLSPAPAATPQAVSAQVTPSFVENDANAAEAPVAPEGTPADDVAFIEEPDDGRVLRHNPWTTDADVYAQQIGRQHAG